MVRAYEKRDQMKRTAIWVGIAVSAAVLVFLLAGLLTSIVERKQEAKNPYVHPPAGVSLDSSLRC